MTEPVFRRRTLVVLAAVCGLSLVSGFVWSVFGADIAGERSSGADAFSRSAIGHRAFAAFLRELDVPVVVSRFRSGARAAGAGLLVLAEPRADVERLDELVRRAPATLLVLPKWIGSPDFNRKGFIAEASLAGLDRVADVLHAVAPALDVRREGTTSSWTARPPALAPVQLVTGPGLRPIVAAAEGVLFGEVERYGGGRLFVLADPDVIANHGLRTHAALAAEIVTRARASDGAVVIDETLHGFERRPDIYHALVQPPLVFATLQALLAVALLFWAGVQRFGAPERPPPVLGAGKTALIGTIAELLRTSRRDRAVLQRYLGQCRDRVVRRLHLSARGTRDQRAARLAALEEVRGVRDRHAALGAEVRGLPERARAGRVVRLAQRIHAWEEEIVHGS